MEPTATMGRPRIDSGIVAKLRAMLDDGVPPAKISEDCGVSVATVYNQRRIWQELKGNPPGPDTAEGGSDNAADSSACPSSMAHAGPDVEGIGASEELRNAS